MHYRLWKTLTSASYLTMIWLTVHFLRGGFDTQFAVGCLVVSAMWLVLTRVEMTHLLRTYFDILSRLQVIVPFVTGVVLAGLAFVSSAHPLVRAGAIVLVVCWELVFVQYERNKALYKTQGHGPLPKGTKVRPPAAMLTPGCLILTSGRIATKLHESVGHGELVLRIGGKMIAFSSYMEQGCVINPLETVASENSSHGHYIALRPRQAWDEGDIELGEQLALRMHEQNQEYIARTRALRDKIIGHLPLPKSAKDRIKGKLPITGYDWFGLFTGRRAPDNWTCIGACMELLWRIGKPTRWYGTGLLGLGTGLLDPIMPDRFITDPAFELITEDMYEQWLKEQGQQSGTTSGAATVA